MALSICNAIIINKILLVISYCDTGINYQKMSKFVSAITTS